MTSLDHCWLTVHPTVVLDSSEFQIINPMIVRTSQGKFDLISDKILDRPFWQCKTGQYSRDVLLILLFVSLHARSDQGMAIKVKSLVIYCPSKLIVGHNLTMHFYVILIGGNGIRLPVYTLLAHMTKLVNL